jgi:anti-sigma regulatory factor (Ser/Thr protein kinase)
VIDRKSNKLVGILTKVDIIRCLLKRLEIDFHTGEVRRYRLGHLFEDIVSDRTVFFLRYDIEALNFEKAGEGSSKLKKNLLKLGIHPDAARRIAIACYEAEMNMVIFSQGGELVAVIGPDRVTVSAVDRGPGIPDVELAMQPGYSTAPDWVRELGFGAGMGLPNIKNCSDEMKIESKVGEGTNVQFTVFTKL